MADSRTIPLQLLITAKDNASAIVGRIFGALDKTTSATANLVREKFTNLFGGGLSGAMDFEAQLDRVAAKGNYTAAEMRTVAEEARKIGAQFGISGAEAAKGMESLAAAGLSATDAIKALPSVLAMASAEQISADAAAQKLIDSLSVMGLGFEQAGRMADVLAKGANITTSSAAQLAEALSEAGGTAKAAGMNLESTVAALDLLHKNGIKGSEAGTALKSILVSLLDPSSKASQELSKLGISSRDLGTVLEAIKGKGSLATAAILAFGTEAGPGLRALLDEGKSGLDDFTNQLKNAGGAAADASAQMSGNLSGAMNSLASVWESLKSALIEPALEPVTQQVRALAAELQSGLSSDKLKIVQDAIKGFAESSGRAIVDFVKSFDFAGAVQSVASFAESAKEGFSAVSAAGSTAANGIQIAWNGLTAGFKTIAGGLLSIVSSFLGNLAVVEEAAAKIGLGTIERANELNEKALAMKAAAAEMFNQVATDGRELGGAFDRMTGSTEKATVAQRDLKKALPIPELQKSKEVVADYTEALERAKTAQQNAAKAAREAQEGWLQAGRAMDQGTGSAQAYEQAAKANRAAQAALHAANENVAKSAASVAQAVQNQTGAAQQAKPATDQYLATWAQAPDGLLKATQAHRELNGGVADVTQSVGAAPVAMNAWRDTLVKAHEGVTQLGDGMKLVVQPLTTIAEKTAEYNRQIKAGTDNAGAWRSGMKLTDVTMMGLKDTVTATSEKLAYLQSIKATLKDSDTQISNAQKALTQAQNTYNTALAENITQQERKIDAVQRANRLDEARYDLQMDQVKAEVQIAKAKGDTAEAARKENEATDLQIEKLQSAAAGKRDEIAAYEDLIAATERKLAADGELDASDKNQLATMADTLKGLQQEQQQLEQSAEKTRELADAQQEAAKKVEEAKKAEAEAAIAAERETRRTAEAVTMVAQSFGQMSEAGKKAWDQFKQANPGNFMADAVGAAEHMMRITRTFDDLLSAEIKAAQQVDELAEAYSRGGQAGVDALRRILDMGEGGTAAIGHLTEAGEAARQKIEDIRQEAMDAEAALNEMADGFTREMLQLQGDQKALLELEQRDRLKQLEEAHQRAGQLGDEEYRTALARADELHRMKLAQLEQEQAAKEQAAAKDRGADVKAAADSYRTLGNELERVNRLTGTLARSDLSEIVGQANALRSTLADVSALL